MCYSIERRDHCVAVFRVVHCSLADTTEVSVSIQLRPFPLSQRFAESTDPYSQDLPARHRRSNHARSHSLPCMHRLCESARGPRVFFNLHVQSMSYTLTYQLSPERTRGLHGSPMNRPQAVNWANRTAAASPRSLRCAAIRAAPIASGTFPLHALRFGLQAPVSAQRRRVRKVPPQAVRNLPHQKMSIHHATTLNVRDASRLSVIGVYMPFARSDIMLPPPTGALRSRGGYRRPAEALHTGYDLREPRKTSRVVDFWQ